MKFKLCLLISVLLTFSALQVDAVRIELENLPEKCDFTKCTALDPTKLNVHLVPHTHDDVGWLKTVDQYYYGSNNGKQKAGVQYILDSVVEELIRNKARRFIYVETAFFWKWWLEQNEEQRAIVKELVKSGQLEFINGGWSMNDEASTHYNSIIDQMAWGLRRLNDTFGRCGVPRVAWQIDPFGHSREQASLFAQMNFDALFFAREDYQDRSHRITTKSLEHMWQGSDDLGTGGDLFTGMMKRHYEPLPGLFWDMVNNHDEPVIDNPESEEYNVPKVIENLVRNAKDHHGGYSTNNIMIPMGSDFHYMDANIYFKNMDKLIKAANNRTNEIKVFYSTPSCYAKALQESGVTFTSKSDDFFPYASGPNSYWTGYFTSRPSVKRYERVGNNILQVCKQVDVLAGNGGKYEKEVTKLREWMGVMQHHDAVTGTEKQHVTDDYSKNLYTAIEGCRSVIGAAYDQLLTTKPGIPPQVSHNNHCNQLNVSSCDFTESASAFIVTVYNPLGHTLVNQTVRIPIGDEQNQFDTAYAVSDENEDPVKGYLVAIPRGVQAIPERQTDTNRELVFQVKSLPPLGLVSYFVKSGSSDSIPAESAAKPISGVRISASGAKLESSQLQLLFDGSGEVSQIQLKDGTKVAFKSEFHTYDGMTDNGQSSGAYVFRPTEQQSKRLAKVTEAEIHQNGPVQEVHQKFDVSYVSQVVRLGEDWVEFDWVVGPIPKGKEIVTKYITDLASQQTFYTDANGRQLLKRVVNHRASWKLSVHEPVSGNYYPVNSRIALRDEARGLQLTVLNDRSQGGSSLANGTLELMVHRRLTEDDRFGVGEPLNEQGTDGAGLVIRGRHIVHLSQITKSASRHRALGQQLFMEPLLSFAPLEPEYTKKYLTSLVGLTRDLPANVHLLTLEEWTPGQVLLRLEHFYQRGEDVELSKPATVTLKGLFTSFEVLAAREVTLGANQDIAALKSRLKFKYTPEGKVVEPVEASFNPTTLEVGLNPMQIRSFILTVKRN